MKKVPKDFTLDHKWPIGLPTKCERCDNTYDKRFSLEVGPGRLGRFLRRTAPWLSVAMFVVLLGLAKHLPTGDFGRILPIPIVILLPSLILYLAGGFLPIKTRLYCYKCDRASYYHSPETWSASNDASLTAQTTRAQKTPAEPGFENCS